MFSVGYGEVCVLLLIALLVIKPGDLPQVAFYIGRALATCRAKWDQLMQELSP